VAFCPISALPNSHSDGTILPAASINAVLFEIFHPKLWGSSPAGEKISTAFAESAVNQVVSKRMVKKQQMRWTESGAHKLLQVRTKVLNDQLRESFVRWYPGMQTEQETEIQKKAA
jgi:hypothetical protein